MSSENVFSGVTLKQEIVNNKKRWKGVLRQPIDNPSYVRAPMSGPDTRTQKQKRKTIYKEHTRIFDDSVKTKRQAEKALEIWRSEMESQAKQPKQACLLLADYIEQYISNRELAQVIEKSTAMDYRRTNRRLAKAFPQTTLHELTADIVQDYEVTELKRGISPTTVSKSHRLLKQVLSHAVKHGHIQKNIMDLVEPPKRPKQKPNGLDIPTAKKLTALLIDSRPSDIVTAAFLALHAGLRIGEVCGLRWSDVDLNNNKINVRRAVAIGNDGAYVKEPKNASSIREIDITQDLADKLAQRYNLMKSQLADAQVFLPETEFQSLYVCGNVSGDYANRVVLSRKWSTIAELNNVIGTEGQKLSFHGLRHAFATVAIATGADAASVAAQMGHATTSQTLNTYTSATAEGKKMVAGRIGDALHPNQPKADVIQFDNTGTGE